MVFLHALGAMAPTMALLFLMYLTLPLVSAFYIYGPNWLVGAYLLTFLPLVVQFFRKLSARSAQSSKPIHPWTMLLPVGPLLLFPLHEVGETVACWFPRCCEISTWKEVKTSMLEMSGKQISFGVSARGWGNPDSFEFTNASVGYETNERRGFEAISCIYLPQLRGHYTNSYTTNFDITREKLVEYVKKNDGFPPEESEKIADEIWRALHDYIEKRNLPPLEYHRFPQPIPRFRYSPTGSGVCLMTIAIATPVLFVASLVLAVWYVGRVRNLTPAPKSAT